MKQRETCEILLHFNKVDSNNKKKFNKLALKQDDEKLIIIKFKSKVLIKMITKLKQQIENDYCYENLGKVQENKDTIMK